MIKVEIYTRMFCGYCSAAKRLLTQKGLEFKELDAGMDPKRRAEMQERSNGGRTFPQIFIDDQHIGGFDELHALDKSGQLDTMIAGLQVEGDG